MMIRTALIFGGRSAEHDVSILSARSVANAAPKSRIEITPICMARDGRFVFPLRSAEIINGSNSDFGDKDFSFESWWRAGNADVLVVYSRTWEPRWGVLANVQVTRLLAKYYEYEPQITSDQIQRDLGMSPVFRWARRGQWIQIYAK